jgi:hypothetical protein
MDALALTPSTNLADPTTNILQIDKPLNADELEAIQFLSQELFKLATSIHTDRRFKELFMQWVRYKRADTTFYKGEIDYPINERVLVIKLKDFLSAIVATPENNTTARHNNLIFSESSLPISSSQQPTQNLGEFAEENPENSTSKVKDFKANH